MPGCFRKDMAQSVIRGYDTLSTENDSATGQFNPIPITNPIAIPNPIKIEPTTIPTAMF